jgi:Uma2 family endonuclease
MGTILPWNVPEEEAAMSAAPKPFLTPEQYLEQERHAETKSEYYDGEVFAMAGGSPDHSLIATNVTSELGFQLRDTPCRVYNSDLRVRGSETDYSYPDLTVVCGEPQLAGENDVLLNPTLIVEVLSPSTEAWDRGGKFERYQQIASLREYLLIAQDRARVERYARQAEGEWLLTVAVGLDGRITLPAIGCELALAEVYRKVAFPENAGRRR